MLIVITISVFEVLTTTYRNVGPGEVNLSQGKKWSGCLRGLAYDWINGKVHDFWLLSLFGCLLDLGWINGEVYNFRFLFLLYCLLEFEEIKQYFMINYFLSM